MRAAMVGRLSTHVWLQSRQRKSTTMTRSSVRACVGHPLTSEQCGHCEGNGLPLLIAVVRACKELAFLGRAFSCSCAALSRDLSAFFSRLAQADGDSLFSTRNPLS